MTQLAVDNMDANRYRGVVEREMKGKTPMEKSREELSALLAVVSDDATALRAENARLREALDTALTLLDRTGRTDAVEALRARAALAGEVA